MRSGRVKRHPPVAPPMAAPVEARNDAPALVGMGVGSAQLLAQGYGESHPVAGNDSAGGRQMNRRVEIVLSEDGSRVAPR